MAGPYHARSRLRENPHAHPPFLSRRHESGTALRAPPLGEPHHPREDPMTARKQPTTRQARDKQSLSLRKRTLKDMAPPREGPKGGFIMKDSVIVRTSTR